MATKIFVDAGHGGTDPGALGNNVRESTVNLSVALQLARLLEQGGYDVMLYRSTETENVLPGKSADLTNRARMANNWGADYFISIMMLPTYQSVILFVEILLKKKEKKNGQN